MRPGRRWKDWAIRATALLALGLVFLAYTQPSLMQQLAEQVWACF